MKSTLKLLIGIGLIGIFLCIIVLINRNYKTIGMSRAVTVFPQSVVTSATKLKKVVDPLAAPTGSMQIQAIQFPGKINDDKPLKNVLTQQSLQHPQLKGNMVQLVANNTMSSPETARKDVSPINTLQSGEFFDKPLEEKKEMTLLDSKTAPRETDEVVSPAIKATPKKIAPVFTVKENSQFPARGLQNTVIPQRVNETSLGMNPSADSETVLDRLKVTCDFQSLGVGYKVFQLKKVAVDILAYTDKAGVGVSFPLTDNFHLGIDNTYKYSNGEQQFRVYLSVPLGAPK